LDPRTPIIVVPVDMSALSGVPDLITGTSSEKAKDTEPRCHHTVNRTESFPLDPWEGFAITHVSEIQAISEVAETP